jgi:DNA-binding MarR family transcriptional regulator
VVRESGTTHVGDVPPADYRALAQFRRLIRSYLRFSEGAARREGLEPQQYQLLLAVKGAPEGQPTTITYVCETLQIRHHSAVELVNRTEARGLVQRVRGLEDRRVVFVTMTEKGDDVLRKLALHHLAELRSAGAELVRALDAVINRRT